MAFPKPSSPGGNTFTKAIAPKPSSPGGNTFAPMAPTPPPSSPGGNTFAPMAPTRPPSSPGGNTFGRSAAPTYTAPAPRAAAPAPYVPPAALYNPGYQTGFAAAEAAPPPPPAPPQGGRQWYNNLDQGARVRTDEQWLGGDSDYTAQVGEYQRALDDFIRRITGQKEEFDLDANKALGATDQNQTFAGNQLGEDFGARGMSYSGLFDKSKNELGTRFEDQRGNIRSVLAKNKNEADNRLADYTAENTIGRSNAKRSALTRMAAQQAMIDAGAGF